MLYYGCETRKTTVSSIKNSRLLSIDEVGWVRTGQITVVDEVGRIDVGYGLIANSVGMIHTLQDRQ